MATSRDEGMPVTGDRPSNGAPVRLAVFVAGGPLALGALEALARRHTVAVLIRAARTRSLRGTLRSLARRFRVRPPDAIEEWARRTGIPIVPVPRGGADAAAARVAAHQPRYGCIATWPRRIPAVLRAAAGAECLNLHSSLLPRHRGASPLFWTYHAGDAEAGVTIHRATDALDAGPMLSQVSIPLARGTPIFQLHARCAELGGPLLADAVTRLAEGRAEPTPQDESRATPAPVPRADTSYADLAHWSSAHAWHFLRGLLGYHQEPLRDTGGRPVVYRDVPAYEVRAPRAAPGSVVAVPGGWEAWTEDGSVQLQADPPGRARR